MEFRPLTAAGLPLVASWLTRPHVAEWWDGPIALEVDLRQALAVLDGEAIGYVQSYQAVACHSDGWWLEVTDPDRAAIAVIGALGGGIAHATPFASHNELVGQKPLTMREDLGGEYATEPR